MTPDVVVDVGNTRIKWGRCGADRVVDMARLDPDPSKLWSEQIAAWSLPEGALWVLAGVHPQRRDAAAFWLTQRRYGVFVLDHHSQLPLNLRVDVPEKVGIDRLLNALAAKARLLPGESALIVDIGSAVTVDRLDATGVFRGGAIMDGLRLMAEALHRYTAKLPWIEVKEIVAYPGTSTEKAMATGILNAVAGGIEKIAREHGETSRIFLTGGDADLLAPALTALKGELWAEMTLEGMRLAALHQPASTMRPPRK